jgi:hypothetical protein
LPNYLVGQVLTRVSDDDAGQALRVIRSRIAERAGCTPFGIVPPESFDKIYLDSFRDSIFGSNESLRCPYQRIADGACTIWAQRNSVCTTWFCKFERGHFSSVAWDAVRDLLEEAEASLSLWCVHHLLGDDEAVALLFKASKESDRDFLRHLDSHRIWGSWYEREEEFFRACAERVAALSWDDVRGIGGEKIAVLERLAGQALSKLNRFDIPSRLVHKGLPGSAFLIRQDRNGQTAVHANSEHYDVQHFDTGLLDRLSAFDGTTSLSDVRAHLQGEGVALSDETLRRLVDYRFLVDTADSDARKPDSGSPVKQEDRLRFVFADVDSQVDFDNEGNGVVRFNCGYKTIDFDEAELLEFGRQLLGQRWGFTAGRSTAWNNGPEPLPWERVAPLLDTLIAEGVLERF